METSIFYYPLSKCYGIPIKANPVKGLWLTGVLSQQTISLHPSVVCTSRVLGGQGIIMLLMP